jgi:GNAT superfamily N-acetyltransferase
MDKIAIRKTRKSDAEQFCRLVIDVWKSTYSHIFPPEVFADNEARLQEKIKNFTAQPNDGISFVATIRESGGQEKIIAIAIASCESPIEHYKKLGCADLWAIYINPKFQKLKLGRKLFDKITAHFLAKGYKKMVIGVLKENHLARSAYEKWGGVLDTYEKPYEKLGEQYPRVYYTFNLGGQNAKR